MQCVVCILTNPRGRSDTINLIPKRRRVNVTEMRETHHEGPILQVGRENWQTPLRQVLNVATAPTTPHTTKWPTTRDFFQLSFNS